MSYPLLPPRKYTSTANIGKSKNTGILMSLIQYNNNTESTFYFNNLDDFLVTSTTGFTQSTYDLSDRVASNYELEDSYLSLAKKPFLETLTKPYTSAGIANSQIDFAYSADLITNSLIRIAYLANFPGANVSVELSDKVNFSTFAQFAVTGSTINLGTVSNPKYETVVFVRSSLGTLSVGVDLSKIIRGRFVAVNSTASNRITPVLVSNGNNIYAFPGSYLSQSVCCAKDFIDKIITETEDIKCGTSTVGKTITSQTIELNLILDEEVPKLLALFMGDIARIDYMDIWKHLAGFEVGQNKNKVVADVLATPTRGEIQLSPNLKIKDLVFDCTSLAELPYFVGLETNANIFLGTGEYSYNPVSGLLYFNILNIGKSPEIKVSDKALVELIRPIPGRLSSNQKVQFQDIDSNGKIRYVKIKKTQFSFPERSIESTGNPLALTGTGYFSKAGDIEYGYQI